MPLTGAMALSDEQLAAFKKAWDESTKIEGAWKTPIILDANAGDLKEPNAVLLGDLLPTDYYAKEVGVADKIYSPPAGIFMADWDSQTKAKVQEKTPIEPFKGLPTYKHPKDKGWGLKDLEVHTKKPCSVTDLTVLLVCSKGVLMKRVEKDAKGPFVKFAADENDAMLVYSWEITAPDGHKVVTNHQPITVDAGCTLRIDLNVK